jgi:ketosteroid isomerase-like protein
MSAESASSDRLPEDPAQFVHVFQTGWLQAKPDGFIDFFRPHLHDEIVGTGPIFPDTHGSDEFLASFRQTFAYIPDITLTVEDWGARGESVFVASRCTGSIGETPLEFRVCDHFVLRDGLIFRRDSYWDPSVLNPPG